MWHTVLPWHGIRSPPQKKKKNEPPRQTWCFLSDQDHVLRDGWSVVLEAVQAWEWQLAGLWLQSGPTGVMLLYRWLVRRIRSKERARCCSRSGMSCLQGWAAEKSMTSSATSQLVYNQCLDMIQHVVEQFFYKNSPWNYNTVLLNVFVHWRLSIGPRLASKLFVMSQIKLIGSAS